MTVTLNSPAAVADSISETMEKIADLVFSDSVADDDAICITDKGRLCLHVMRSLSLTLTEAEEIVSELADYGIETADAFDDAYYGKFDGYHAEREFAEEYYLSMGVIDTDNPLFGYIDWQDEIGRAHV